MLPETGSEIGVEKASVTKIRKRCYALHSNPISTINRSAISIVMPGCNGILSTMLTDLISANGTAFLSEDFAQINKTHYF